MTNSAPFDVLAPRLAIATAAIKILFWPNYVVKVSGLGSNAPGKTAERQNMSYHILRGGYRFEVLSDLFKRYSMEPAREVEVTR